MYAFLDTGSLVARVSGRDPDHKSVMNLFQNILKGDLDVRILVTTNYIIDEAVTFAVRSTRRHDLGIEILDLVEQSRLIRTEWITHDREERARSLFRERSDKDYSFTDITSFVVMREIGIMQAITFDEHFSQEGFICLP